MTKIVGDIKARLGLDDSKYKKGLKDAQTSSSKFGSAIKKLGGILAGVFAVTKIVQWGKELLQFNVKFEKSLAGLSAITGAVGDDLKYYSKAAREIGKSTTIGANEAVEAIKLMGSARPELLKNKEALVEVTKQALVLAEASGLDLTTATLSLAKTMSQFNVPATEAGKVINILAAGSKFGAEEVPGLADAVKGMGTAAYMANISLEQSVAMIETLAEKGITAGESGVALRNVILKLQSGLDKFNPKIVGMSTALDNLAAANLSAADLTEMFGLRNQQSASILIKNRKRVDELTIAVTGTNTAYDQQAIMLDTLDAKWKIFTGNLRDATLQSQEFIDIAKETLTQWTKLIQLSKTTPAKKISWWGKRGRIFTDVDPEAEAVSAKAAAAEAAAAAAEAARAKALIDAAAAAKAVIKTINTLTAELEKEKEVLNDINIADKTAIRNQIQKINLLERYIKELSTERGIVPISKEDIKKAITAPKLGAAITVDTKTLAPSLAEANLQFQQLLQNITETQEKEEMLGQITTDVFSGFADVISRSFMETGNVLKNFGKFFIDFIKGMIAKLVAAAIAAIALAIVISLIPGLNVGMGAKMAEAVTFVTRFKAGFGLMTGMAAGGVIPGGYSNDTFPAMLTSGERVLTPAQNKNYESGGGPLKVIIEGKLRGKDMYLQQVRYVNELNSNT